MKKETWRRVDDCLADALELPMGERAAFLALHLGDDEEALAQALRLVGGAAGAGVGGAEGGRVGVFAGGTGCSCGGLYGGWWEGFVREPGASVKLAAACESDSGEDVIEVGEGIPQDGPTFCARSTASPERDLGWLERLANRGGWSDALCMYLGF